MPKPVSSWPLLSLSRSAISWQGEVIQCTKLSTMLHCTASVPCRVHKHDDVFLVPPSITHQPTRPHLHVALLQATQSSLLDSISSWLSFGSIMEEPPHSAPVPSLPLVGPPPIVLAQDRARHRRQSRMVSETLPWVIRRKFPSLPRL